MVGTHCLPTSFTYDVDGNAGALDVYAFLRLPHEGQTLLELMLSDDPDVLSALSENEQQARAWLEAFAAITKASDKPASHTLAKQIYWLVGPEPRSDADYHLLAPLHASSLAQAVFLEIEEDLFGEPATDARKAKRDGTFSDAPLRTYPNLALQQIGGTSPKSRLNISSLNSSRRGKNYLLASLPPLWVSPAAKPPLRTDTVLRGFSRRERVRARTAELRKFLESDPPENQPTRDRRDALALDIVEELFLMEMELLQLDAGWSGLPECRLPEAEACWLDPQRVEHDEAFARMRASTDWPAELCGRFAAWLNASLNGRLTMDDAVHDHWYELLQEEFKARQREGFYD